MTQSLVSDPVLLDPYLIKNRPLLDGIQGNILKAHGRHHTANLFIHCRKNHKPEARLWLKSLVEGEDPLVRSGYAQLRSNLVRKENPAIDTGLFACIHISAAGYRYLFDDQITGRFADVSFQKGMKDDTVNTSLNDPKVESWETGFQAENHFMLLLAYTDEARLRTVVDEINRAVQSFADVTTVEWGRALLNEEGAGIEHFGYVDGISQPLFFTDEWETYKAQNNIQSDADIKFDPRARKELVLVEDPFLPAGSNAWGSYFVFRKLEQNVKGFKQAEADLASFLEFTDADDKERAGGMVVGRFEDGTPIEIDPDGGLISSAVLNNFTYDPAGNSKCPFHGHVRKTNPRVGPVQEGEQVVANHVMARRGIPFGERTDGPNDGNIYNKPTGGVGLLFMSYQASIQDQFDVIQKGANNAHQGIDPVIGQGNRTSEGEFATTWGSDTHMKSASFDQFVHLKGGEYFFAPSMNFLKAIDTITP